MLSSHSTHNLFENELAGGYRTRTPGPGFGRKIQDQNATAIQTNGKGKKVVFTPYTPARQAKGKDGLISGKAPRTNSKLGALLDKTPFPNRQSNIPTANLQNTNQKSALPLPKSRLVFTTSALAVANTNTYEGESTSPLPSSTRKKLKLPSSATKLFDVTPPSRMMSNGWDISDGSIELGSPVLEQPPPVLQLEPDEPEYMPPTAIESDYEPEFELPDFTELGKSLRNLSCFDYEEYNPEDFVDDKALLKAGGWVENDDEWERLPLEPIDSDDDSPFIKIKLQSKVGTKTAFGKAGSKQSITANRRVASKPSSKGLSGKSRVGRSTALTSSSKVKPSASLRSQAEPTFFDFGSSLGSQLLVDEFDISFAGLQ